MKITQPDPVFLEGGDKAVILLHSFTGTTRDMKELGEHLNSNGYTVYIPIFEGHGMGPDPLVESGPEDWWNNVVESYELLKDKGYDKISISGVSLGGILSLKAAFSLEDINSAVVMSVPQGKDIEDLNKRVVSYTENFMEFVGRSDEEIDEKLKGLEEEPMASLPEFESLIDEVHSKLGEISVPLAVKYGGKDAALYEESADHIYDEIESEAKDMKVYPNTGHLMTKGKDKKLLFKDILDFFDHHNK
ncbi:alpha/beta hydrolase [Salinicoccus sp. HZC-1]|uniref:alpha/beta hydrolase n=1 Tax=Salinicoccus sp. HZC-1 TaxID=3385497 RepID=UPI00398B662E